MDRTAKLYKLKAELTMLKNDIQQFEALRPNPTEWTQNEVAHYDSLTKRCNDIRAAIAELGPSVRILGNTELRQLLRRHFS